MKSFRKKRYLLSRETYYVTTRAWFPRGSPYDFVRIMRNEILILVVLAIGFARGLPAQELRFGLSADVTPLDAAERADVELLWKDSSDLGFLEKGQRLAVQAVVQGKMSQAGRAWNVISSGSQAKFTLSQDSRSLIDKVNRGELEMAAVRGDVLAATPAFARNNLCNVADVQRGESREQTFVVISREGHLRKREETLQDYLTRSRIGVSEKATPREALSLLSPEGRALGKVGEPSRVLDAEEGIDELFERRMDLTIVSPAQWNAYRRRKPGRAKRVEVVHAEAGFVALASTESDFFTVTGRTLAEHLRGIRPRTAISAGIGEKELLSAFHSWRESAGIQKGVFRPAARTQLDYDNAEDLLDDIGAGNGVDATVLPIESWRAYLRRKPGRAGKLKIVEELPPVPPVTIICNKSIAREAGRVRNALLRAHEAGPAKDLLLVGGFSGIRMSRFLPPGAKTGNSRNGRGATH